MTDSVRRLARRKCVGAVLDDPWPRTERPPQLDFIEVDEALLDTVSHGSVVELARRAGVLLLEEERVPDLVRVRLKRNRAE